MLSSSNFIRLPFSPDLTPAGIAIASRRLALTSLTGEPKPVDSLRADVAHACVELAFRRYLLEEHIPFELEETHPFTEPDQITIVLGGRRMLIETSLTSKKEVDLDRLLNTSIRISARFLSPEGLSGNDLAVFAFVFARTHFRHDELLQADRNGEPFLCQHIMPMAWRRIRVGKAQGRLSFIAAGASPMIIDLNGLDLQQRLCVERISLVPQKWVKTEFEYLTLSCLQTSAIPAARVEILSPAHRKPYSVLPLQWENLWVYGREILFAGYLPLEHIRKLGHDSTQTNFRSWRSELSISELCPLQLFLEQVARSNQ